MTDIASRSHRRPQSRPRADRSPLLLPVATFGAAALAALALTAYLLWPRWPGATVALDAPAFPITIHGVAFNIPPAAVRVAVQRRPGAHARVDLTFLWPSLQPPDPAAKPAPPAQGTLPSPTQAFERLFVTIAGAGDTIAPADRVRTIYPRYAAAQPSAGPDGLALLAFRDGTPYQGEDLIYDQTADTGFLVRCTRNGAGPTPGSCLYDRRIEKADVVVRFPRDWLDGWRPVADGIDKLIARLRPRG
jgi:hypothetical protein